MKYDDDTADEIARRIAARQAAAERRKRRRALRSCQCPYHQQPRRADREPTDAEIRRVFLVWCFIALPIAAVLVVILSHLQGV